MKMEEEIYDGWYTYNQEMANVTKISSLVDYDTMTIP